MEPKIVTFATGSDRYYDYMYQQLHTVAGEVISSKLFGQYERRLLELWWTGAGSPPPGMRSSTQSKKVRRDTETARPAAVLSPNVIPIHSGSKPRQSRQMDFIRRKMGRVWLHMLQHDSNVSVY